MTPVKEKGIGGWWIHESNQKTWVPDTPREAEKAEKWLQDNKIGLERMKEDLDKIWPEGAGTKHDKGKLRWRLLPWKALAYVVRVLMHGAKIHGDNNWKLLPNFQERYWDALQRHQVEYLTGVRVDADSGLPTLAHLCCDALFLLAYDVGFDPNDFPQKAPEAT